MRRAMLLPLVIGCGRVSFEHRGDAGQVTGDGDSSPADTTMLDAGLPAGLVAWFPFTSGSLADAIDGLQGGSPPVQAPLTTPGHRGEGVLFDGVDDCVTVPEDGRFEAAQITIAIWARQDVVGTMSQVSKRSVGGSANAWQLETDPEMTAPMALSFTTLDSSNFNQYLSTPANALQLGVWHHLAATYDGDMKHVFVDGVERATIGGAEALIYDGMPVKIGCDDNAPEARFFAGALDEFQVYNRALPPTEITDLAAR